MQTNDFILRSNRGIPYYSCRAFESLTWLHHGFSTRHGGAAGSLNLMEASSDCRDQVEENKRRFLAALYLEDASLITMHQVHSKHVHIIDEHTDLLNPRKGDALITRRENAALAIKTADCFPILIADPMHKAIGAVHSGWRGTLSGILPETIQAMQREFRSNPAELFVAVGPGIRSCCFEVGKEVMQSFREVYPDQAIGQAITDRPEKYWIDMCNILKIQMDDAGIRADYRYDLGICTCCNTSDFFSYRAEGAASGRMMAIIGISSNNKENR
jgi:polyphenol oxidase